MRVHRIIAALGGAAALLLTAAPAGAQAEHIKEHYSVAFTDPAGSNPCNPSITGALTVQGDGVFTLTDTGQTFQLKDNLQGRFSFDPDDPALPTSSGHFVVQHRENVNYDQLKDWRVTDTQHTVVHLADGTSFPIQIRTTLLFHPDGSFEVKVDSLGCGGPSN
jgi:hypothetical protein